MTNLQVDPVSRSSHRTLFRVQFTIPTRQVHSLKDQSSWPLRISVAPWRGNPKTKLQPLESHQQKKKLYIGNLPESVTSETVVSNMHRIYEEEINSGKIEQIEAFLNEAGMMKETATMMTNPLYEIKKSFCVVLTSKPGESLQDLSLKIDHYQRSLQRSVRYWSGEIPWPKDHPSAKKPVIDLSWR